MNNPVYWNGTGNIPNFLNKLIHEVPDFASTVIVSDFLVK